MWWPRPEVVNVKLDIQSLDGRYIPSFQRYFQLTNKGTIMPLDSQSWKAKKCGISA